MNAHTPWDVAACLNVRAIRLIRHHQPRKEAGGQKGGSSVNFSIFGRKGPGIRISWAYNEVQQGKWNNGLNDKRYEGNTNH